MRYGFYFGVIIWGGGVDGSNSDSKYNNKTIYTNICEGLYIKDPVSIED